MTEWLNALEEVNSRATEAEEWISELEYKMVEITAAEQNKEKRMKINADSLRNFWDNVKCTSICKLGVSEREEKTWEHIED